MGYHCSIRQISASQAKQHIPQALPMRATQPHNTHPETTHTHTHTQRMRDKILYYYTHHSVPGRKITSQKLHVLCARLSLLAPSIRQDVFNRGPHPSQTTLSKHINTLLLTDKKHGIFLQPASSGIQGGKQPFFQMDGQVSYKSSQGVCAAFKDPRGQCGAT